MTSPPYKILFYSCYRFKICTQVGILNVRHFGMVEATILRCLDLMSPSTSPPPHKFSSKSASHFKSCTHHSSLNVRHFGMVEVTRLISIESMWSSTSSPPYKISSKSKNQLKVAPPPPQIFKRQPFWNSWRYGIKYYRVKVAFNVINSMKNFIKINQSVQK
jgi:hypothetical protein